MKNLLISAAVLSATSLVPIIPQDMQWSYAYQYRPNQVAALSEASTTPTGNETPTSAFKDTDGNGVVSVSVFIDRKGNEVLVQIPDSKYAEMGGRDGHRKNPTKDEFISAFESLTATKAKAAVAYGNYTTGSASSASSVTFSSPSVSGSNTLGTVMTFHQTNENINSVTWDGSGTFIARASQESGGRRIELWYTLTPTAGVTNIVVTRDTASGLIRGDATFYTGMRQSAQPDAFTTSSASAVSTLTTTLTVVADGSWTVLAARNTAGNYSAGTGTTLRSAVGNPVMGDSNAALSSGANSMSVTSASATHMGIMASFAPSVSVAVPITSDAVIFE